jgi:zinc protease
MKLRNALVNVLAAVLATACAAQAPQASDPPAPGVDDGAKGEAVPLPVDPSIRIGQLDNGLTYYIRQHDQPKERAQLWLAVDAGSVLEDDDQKGLAHFVEHMAFNGTERFQKNTLIDFIERAGMDFGADLNAYTSFDETVYMLTVPTDDDKFLQMGMDILEDWAGALSFDPEEVEKERGVVVEEWRLGRGAQQRVFDKQWPIFLEGSLYAQRKPIGEKDILETAPVETLKRFYRDWYRPDLMAVVVVGDIDPDAMEKEIRRRFEPMPKSESPRARDNVPVPLHEKTRAAIVTDPEAQIATVSLAIKGPYTPLVTEDDFRDELVETLFHGMLRARLDELRRDPKSPFMYAFSFTGDMGRAVDLFQLTAGAKPGQVEEAVKTLAVEVERVRRHGFLAAELERARAETMRGYERAAQEQDKAESRNYAREIVRHFLEGEAMPGRDAELELAARHIPSITLDEVNALAGRWASRKDRVVLASGPARDEMPSEKSLLATVDSVLGLDVDPYTEEDSTAPLMADKPKAGSITKEETLDDLGVTVWTLSNGAKVIVKPTDFKNDEIVLEAFSPGGHSLAPAKAYRSASEAAGIVAQAGLGEHDATRLRKLLAGRVARVTPHVGELEEGLRGSASPRDLEVMMQLVHLTFTAPRKDPRAFEAWKSSAAAFVKNRDLNPQMVFFEKLTAFIHDDHPRRRPLTVEALEEVDHDVAFEFYQDRFAEAGDFTFVFVGNVDLEQLRAFTVEYLASLPSQGRKEKWRDVGVPYPRGIKRFELEKGQDPKSFVFINFHGTTRWSPEAENDLRMVAEVIDIRLREVLREEMGGVYGAFSRGRIERRPRERYAFGIGFGCAPENVQELEKAVFDIIAEVKKSGISDDYLDKVKEQRRRKLETDQKTNHFWLDALADHHRYGMDPRTIVQRELEAIERVTSKNVQRAARRYLGKQFVGGVLMPDSPEQAANDGTAQGPAKKATAG